MTGKTIKQIFKAVNDINNANEVIGANRNGINNLEVLIYIDDMKIYRGNSYKDFDTILRNEYVEPFANELENLYWCGDASQMVQFDGVKSKVEIYFID